MILKSAKNEIGATAIEYGLIASLIGVLAISGMSVVGKNLSNTYCTVSKYLGGSGECSSGSSKGTGENGSGSSADSGNNTTGNGENGSGTPIITKDDMDNLKNSLVDDFDDNYLDSSLGGNNTSSFGLYHPSAILSLMNNYNKNNPNDLITHVFGLYDSSTNKPITSWQRASQGIENDINGSDMIETNNVDSIEVTTQSGHVYNVNGDNNKMIENLKKGSY
ncbi:Flp family type IVb pilin [Acetobacter orientalis]|uniref:Flp family type IVb pilin n=1 Tax=Acetobacter orientalis TaxID=146474 RepID=UPI00241C5AE5|nr:Flp family type IVb pilin [Acetobacter orientalis]